LPFVFLGILDFHDPLLGCCPARRNNFAIFVRIPVSVKFRLFELLGFSFDMI
jgi:hypothetical protein